MRSKPEIVFTFPACIGGVSSFNYNIINYSEVSEKCKIRVILLNEESDSRALFLDVFKADEVTNFKYSEKENQYYVQKRLNKLLHNSNGAIVTDNGLTIHSARRFNNPKTVFQLIHDEYYVDLNTKMGNLVDVAIAHSSFFSDAVIENNPDLYLGRCFYIPYGVKQLSVFPTKNENNLKLVFLGRLDEKKGVLRLYEIDKILKKQNIAVDWTIIGKGKLRNDLRDQWKHNSNVSFWEPDSTDAVYQLLADQDIFVFPTEFEGTPVSILECLANAVVTITNDLPGGIRDIIKQGIGYRCKLNNITEFVDHITELNINRALLKTMQKNCFELGRSSYDITKNADAYFSLFLQYDKFKRTFKTQAPNMFRLDKVTFPNILVKIIRTFK